MQRLLLSLLSAALVAAVFEAAAQTPVEAPPNDLQPHIAAVRQEMLGQVEALKVCIPRARLVTADSYIPFGITKAGEVPSAKGQDFFVNLVRVARSAAAAGKIRASVLAICQSSTTVGNRTLGPVITVSVESANGYAADLNIKYHIEAGVLTADEEVWSSSSGGLVFGK